MRLNFASSIALVSAPKAGTCATVSITPNPKTRPPMPALLQSSNDGARGTPLSIVISTPMGAFAIMTTDYWYRARSRMPASDGPPLCRGRHA